jgi:hypothetical protein
MLRLTGCCFLLFCNPALSISAEQKPLPFYSQVQSGVVRLEHYEVIQKEGQGEPSRRTVPDGTGFFVHDVQHCYIVTAGHVARQDYDLHGAVPLNQTATGKVEVWDLILPRSHWLFHREKGSATTHPVDVAVMKIAETPGWEKKAFSYCPVKCREKEYNQLEQHAEPPDEVVIFGFPLDIGLKLKEPRPMGRRGTVALQANEEFIIMENKFVERQGYLVEAKMFPGNSGSPVIKMPLLSGKLYLVGLVMGSNPNLDYAVVEPVSRIQEVLDIAKTSQRMGSWRRREQQALENHR